MNKADGNSTVPEKIKGVQDVDTRRLLEFKRLMTEEVIPEIVKVIVVANRR